MQQLNQKAKSVFRELLDRIGDSKILYLQAPGLVALAFEEGETVFLSDGFGALYRLSWHEPEKKNAQRREMVFLVQDQRKKDKSTLRKLTIYPQSFVSDAEGIDEKSFRITNPYTFVFEGDYSAGHAWFANHWLAAIRAQGYLQLPSTGRAAGEQDAPPVT